MKGFGVKIFELRQSKGISQKDLAKLLGITEKDVDLLEQGELEPTGETYRLLSVYFDIPLKELVAYKETELTEEDANNNVIGKCVKCGKPITKWENSGVYRFGHAQMDFCESCKKEYVKQDLQAKENDYDYRLKKAFKRATLICLLEVLFGLFFILNTNLKMFFLISTLIEVLFTFTFVAQLHFKGFVIRRVKASLERFHLTAKVFGLIYIDFWKNVWRITFGTATAIFFAFVFYFEMVVIIFLSPFSFIRATTRFLDERKEISDHLDALAV